MESRSFSQNLREGPDGSVSLPVDRISNLPEAILCYILSFCPIKFVVATGLLSKRWRYLWTQVNTLEFDDTRDLVSDRSDRHQYSMNFDDTHDLVSVRSDRDQYSKNFAQFVNRVLLHQNAGCMGKFYLKWLIECQAVYVNTWVSCAIARKVKTLHLFLRAPNSSANDFAFRLPGALFVCGTLEILLLNGPILVKVPGVVWLPKLTALTLEEVLYESDEAVPKLISGCPVLHSLYVERSEGDGVKVYSISSPALRRVRIGFICDTPFLRQKLEIDAPALESFVLRDLDYPLLDLLEDLILDETELLDDGNSEDLIIWPE